MFDPPSEVTHLLKEWSDGDPAAPDKLMPLLIDEVGDLARRAPGDTLVGLDYSDWRRTTALPLKA